MPSLIKITMCGFPAYACGHTLVLLIDDACNRYLLAHVHAHVPEELSPSGRLPFIQYWLYNLFTNKLNKIVIAHSGISNVKQHIETTYKRSLLFSCLHWTIDQTTCYTIYQKILTESQQAVIDRFCFAGKMIGSWTGANGSNCMDWTNDLLHQLNVPGQHITYANLKHLLHSA